MSVRIDLKEKITYKEFEKQFGSFYRYSSKAKKQERTKAAYAKAIAKFD